MAIGDLHHRQPNGKISEYANDTTIAGKNDAALKPPEEPSKATTFNLLVCVGGIYASL